VKESVNIINNDNVKCVMININENELIVCEYENGWQC